LTTLRIAEQIGCTEKALVSSPKQAPSIVHARVPGMRSTIPRNCKPEPEAVVEYGERIPVAASTSTAT
jgi:hypothetical protein